MFSPALMVIIRMEFMSWLLVGTIYLAATTLALWSWIRFFIVNTLRIVKMLVYNRSISEVLRLRSGLIRTFDLFLASLLVVCIGQAGRTILTQTVKSLPVSDLAEGALVLLAAIAFPVLENQVPMGGVWNLLVRTTRITFILLVLFQGLFILKNQLPQTAVSIPVASTGAYLWGLLVISTTDGVRKLPQSKGA